MKTSPRFGASICALFSSVLLLPSAFPQGGSLTPPGPPAPTMKSLDQIASTGIAINATNTPGDTNYEAVISAAGGYYLTGNLDVAKANGIHVTVAGVTIDLNGFQIDRASGSGGDGITIDGIAHRCTVKNGSVSGFATGVNCSVAGSNIPLGGSFLRLAVSACTSIGLLSRGSWLIESCEAHNNPATGISAGLDTTVTNCTAYQNHTGINTGDGSTLANCAAYGNTQSGIVAGGNCTLTNCSATGNTADGIVSSGDACALTNCSAKGNGIYGISMGGASTLTNCTANSNSSAASFSGGITVGDDSSLHNCSASNNTTTNGTHTATTGGGFVLGSNCTMQGCSASNNSGDGVSFVGNCLITGNNAAGNGFTGFHVTGSLNRIDGNIAVGNRVGFLWINDFVVRNTAFGNTVGGNYSPAVGMGNTGPVQTASTATNPWANF